MAAASRALGSTGKMSVSPEFSRSSTGAATTTTASITGAPRMHHRRPKSSSDQWPSLPMQLVQRRSMQARRLRRRGPLRTTMVTMLALPARLSLGNTQATTIPASTATTTAGSTATAHGGHTMDRGESVDCIMGPCIIPPCIRLRDGRR